tara:strand:- start:118 stop:537 length:420 start_codon:yes stop_codon:yes gene_type:complete
MRFRHETTDDLTRERKAIEKFVNLFDGRFKKLGPNDIDFRIYDSSNRILGYAEVKGKKCVLKDAFPLYVAARKLVKLCDKRLNPVIIWACDDGIIYAKVPNIEGTLRWGGRSEKREDTLNDQELMVYFEYSREFKYLRY